MVGAVVASTVLVACQPMNSSPSSESPADSPVVSPAEEMSAGSEALSLRDRLITNITLTVPDTTELISFGGEQGEWSDGYVLIGDQVATLPNGAVAAILQVNSGGTARDVYLAVFEMGEASWQMADAALLGEYASNAEVTSLTTDAETIRVAFLTYGDDMEAQASPKTQENQATFTFVNGKLNQE